MGVVSEKESAPTTTASLRTSAAAEPFRTASTSRAAQERSHLSSRIENEKLTAGRSTDSTGSG